MHTLLSLSLHFYWIYLRFSSGKRTDATSTTWSSVSLNMGKHYHKMSSVKLLVNWKSGYVHGWWWKDVTLNIC